MNTLDIYRVLASHPVTKVHFTGVFAADRLPRCTLPRPSICVANSDASSQGGTHWLAFYIPDDREHTAEYFDSFGLKPINKFFTRFLTRHSRLCVYNNRVLQSLNSASCGKFVCLYLLYRCMGFSILSFLKLFTKNLVKNERVVRRLFRFHFPPQPRSNSVLYPTPADYGYPCSNLQHG